MEMYALVLWGGGGCTVLHGVLRFVCVDDQCITLLQIADFGMSRDLAHQDYYITSGGRIPLKWTAPEVILLANTVAWSHSPLYGYICT